MKVGSADMGVRRGISSLQCKDIRGQPMSWAAFMRPVRASGKIMRTPRHIIAKLPRRVTSGHGKLLMTWQEKLQGTDVLRPKPRDSLLCSPKNRGDCALDLPASDGLMSSYFLAMSASKRDRRS
jgi:hypothetical protein